MPSLERASAAEIETPTITPHEMIAKSPPSLRTEPDPILNFEPSSYILGTLFLAVLMYDGPFKSIS